jgi:hypothetical protein
LRFGLRPQFCGHLQEALTRERVRRLMAKPFSLRSAFA